MDSICQYIHVRRVVCCCDSAASNNIGVFYCSFHSVLSILSFLCKAPLVPRGTPLVNALFRQRACIDNILRACVGLAPINNMLLEYKHERQVGQNVSESASWDIDSTAKVDHIQDTKVEPVPVMQPRAAEVSRHA